MQKLSKYPVISIGNKELSLQDKIKGLLIQQEISYSGCPKEFGPMKPTECVWDFSGIPLEEVIRLMWNSFKVEVRKKYFDKLLNEGGMKKVLTETGRGKTVRAIEALYRPSPDLPHDILTIKAILTVVETLIEMATPKEAIIEKIRAKFNLAWDDAETYYQEVIERTSEQ